MNSTRHLLLLVHDGSWDRLYQATSAAATAASTGWRVDLVFYFGALRKLLDGRLDDFDFEQTASGVHDALGERAAELGTRPPSGLLAAARGAGSCRVMACSASLGLLGVDPVEVDPAVVDEIIGWPTTLDLVARADHTLYL